MSHLTIYTAAPTAKGGIGAAIVTECKKPKLHNRDHI